MKYSLDSDGKPGDSDKMPGDLSLDWKEWIRQPSFRAAVAAAPGPVALQGEGEGEGGGLGGSLEIRAAGASVEQLPEPLSTERSVLLCLEVLTRHYYATSFN